MLPVPKLVTSRYPEPTAVSPVLKSVAATHDASVDARHDKRAYPDVEFRVVLDPMEVAFVTEVRFSSAVWAQSVRIVDEALEAGGWR